MLGSVLEEHAASALSRSHPARKMRHRQEENHRPTSPPETACLGALSKVL